VTRNIIDEDNAWREDWVRRMNEADTELREKILASYPNLTLPQLMDFIRDEIIAGMGVLMMEEGPLSRYLRGVKP
jgi:glutaredoxin-related protein